MALALRHNRPGPLVVDRSKEYWECLTWQVWERQGVGVVGDLEQGMLSR